MIGKQIAHYEITEKIGEGGMGEVYLAEDASLNRKVALKFLPPHLQLNETARKRFLREAKAAAGLDHPFICSIHEVGHADGRDFISMEYVEGQTLRELLDQDPLPVEQTLRIASEIAEALEKAHTSDIVHRDLKPSNIMLTPEGHAKVMDFGLAKRLAPDEVGDQKTTVSDLTSEGATIGTVPYMSPEQVRGQEVDARSDIFSFGVVLYEMLAAVHPFKKQDGAETASAILKDDPPSLYRYREDLPPVLQHVVRKMLAKDPESRHQSMHEVRTELLQLSETHSGERQRSGWGMAAGASLGTIALVAALWFWPRTDPGPPGPVPERKSVAVLPFDNLSADPDDEFFSDGVTGEIISQLAKIGDLKVISRTSSMQYKDTTKNLRQIGEELGVSVIIEGTVRRADKRVLITAQLIDATTDDNLWAQTYDRELSDIFAVQSDVALQIADALETNLTPGEKADIEDRPTESVEAYNYYLRALSYQHRSTEERDVVLWIQTALEAIKLDPNFAHAYALLSVGHSRMYWFSFDSTEERIAQAKAAADEALRLRPDLPEGHSALGYYYYHCHLDYDRALEEFAKATAGRPNDSLTVAGIGYVRRRQGQFEEAAANLRKASQLDPRSAEYAFELAQTYSLLRQWEEAEVHYELAFSLGLEMLQFYGWKALLYVASEGNIEKAQAVLNRLRERGLEEENALTAYFALWIEIYDGNYREALGRLSTSRREAFDNQFYFVPKELAEAAIYGFSGQAQSEQAHYESARKILEDKIQENPEDSRFHTSLGIAYAGMGRKEDAIREGKLGTELMPITKEAVRAAFRLEDLARIYVMVGEYDAAVEQLDVLLSVPSRIAVPLLQIDPVWAPLHDQPKFKELVERYSR